MEAASSIAPPNALSLAPCNPISDRGFETFKVGHHLVVSWTFGSESRQAHWQARANLSGEWNDGDRAMDFHAFASLAHVRILLIPVGTIQRTTYEKCVAEIRAFDTIRLEDIPVDSKDERGTPSFPSQCALSLVLVGFMPNPLSTGHLHLSFPSHPPPPAHAPLSLLRPAHFPMAVIGLAVCSQTDFLSATLAQFESILADSFPSDSMFPLAKNCFVFEDGDGATNMNLGENIPGLVVIPSLMGNKRLYIGTLLADLCSHILAEFGVVVCLQFRPPLAIAYGRTTVTNTGKSTRQ